MIFASKAWREDPRANATHVLIVGCGEYPHLGAISPAPPPPLDSPVLSAHALAHWFLRSADCGAFRNPDAPLGTLDMLTAPATRYTLPCGHHAPVATSDFEPVRDAYRRWVARLGDNPSNRGVFYFCGHGIGDGIAQTLLANDVGLHGAHDRFWGAFNLANTFEATIRVTRAPVLFLVDACFEFNRKLLFETSAASGLLSGDRSAAPRSASFLLRAAGANRLTYAVPGRVAQFTHALLYALRGCGHQLYPATCRTVTAVDLLLAVTSCLGIINAGIGRPEVRLGDAQGTGFDVVFYVLDRWYEEPNRLTSELSD